jgi:hypothetical protein
MNLEQQKEYVRLNNKLALEGTLTPPEEAELDRLGDLIVDAAYQTVPASVRAEIESYLERDGPHPVEFYQGMIHAVRWINETMSHVNETEVELAIVLGVSLLSLSASSKIQEVQQAEREKLANIFNRN